MSWAKQDLTGTYRLTHLPTKKYYVGSTANFVERKAHHMSCLRNKSHHNQQLQELFDRSPEVEFTFTPTLNREVAYQLEQNMLDRGNSLLLNVSKDAKSPTGGRKLPPEHRAKIGDAHRGKVISAEARIKMSVSASGRKASDVTREKMSSAQRGVLKSPQHRQAAAVGKLAASGKPLSIKGVVYPGLAFAARQTGMDARFIVRRLTSSAPEYNDWFWVEKETRVEPSNYIPLQPDALPNPSEDGKTHINVYSKGATQLGQDLSNFAHLAFEHPDHGFFASMEAYWYWTSTGRQHEHLRRLYKASAKAAGIRLLKVEMDPEIFRAQICDGLKLKVMQNRKLRDALKKSHLPLRHYFFYGSAPNWVIKEKTDHRYQMVCLEEIRSALQQHRPVLLSDGRPAVGVEIQAVVEDPIPFELRMDP